MRKIFYIFLLLINFVSAQQTLSLYFEVDESLISVDEVKKLVISFQFEHFKVKEVRGYCDARGSLSYNDALAQRRINSVLHRLDELLINHENVVQKVIGERQLKNAAIHAQNRRVDLLIEILPKRILLFRTEEFLQSTLLGWFCFCKSNLSILFFKMDS